MSDRYRHNDNQATYDLSQYDDAQSDSNSAISNQAIRARIEGGYDHLKPKGTTGQFDQRIHKMKYQIGTDGKLYEGDAGEIYFGVTGQYATAHSNIASDVGVGSIDTNSWALHGSMTWYGNDGYYLDAQTQTNWYTNDLFSATTNNAIANGKRGFGYAMSLEAGKQIDLDDEWSLTPQAQLMWSSVSLGYFMDVYQSHIAMNDANSLQLRIGMAVDHRSNWSTFAGTPVAANVYGIVNVYQEFDGGSSMSQALI